MENKYSKVEAIENAKEFIKKVNDLEKEFGFSFNTDDDDIYLSYATKEGKPFYDTIKLGFIGDGSGIKVTERIKDKNFHKKQALSKLSKEEIEALGL